MRTHLRLGRLLGVPIGLNWGVLVVCLLLAVSLAAFSLPTISPGHPTSAYWFAAVLGVLGFLVSLVGHELGHSYIADRNDVRVVEITLWLFGGVAKLEGDADNPGAEFRIAAAGPAMSFVMAGLFWAGFLGARALDGSEVLVTLLIWLALINVVLAVSNLLPAFPLDGGRMLRATLWRRRGRKGPATRVAALWGQLLAAAMVVGAGVSLRWWSWWSALWIAMLGAFLFVAARSEWRGSSARPELLECRVGTIGRALPPALAADASVSKLEAVLAANPRSPLVPVLDGHGHLSSLVLPDSVMRVPPNQRAVVPVASLAEPMWSLPRVHPDESVREVVDRLGPGRVWRAVITDGTELRGVLCSEDVDGVLELATP